MTHEEAALRIRTQMNLTSDEYQKAFWKGVLIGFTCGVNNLNLELMKDLALEQGKHKKREVIG